jgi:ParB family chromosome partitioning protein
LAQRSDIALIALTHRLVLQTFFNAGYSFENVMQIDTEVVPLDQYAPGVQTCKALAVLTRQGEELRSLLPSDSARVFGWLLQQPQDVVLRMCAYCVAVTLNGVTADEEGHGLDVLAIAVGLDMRDWWTATADSYFASLPKARILEVVREAVSPEVAATLAGLKKKPLVAAAEQRLAGTGWLPVLLRNRAT